MQVLIQVESHRPTKIVYLESQTKECAANKLREKEYIVLEEEGGRADTWRTVRFTQATNGRQKQLSV